MTMGGGGKGDSEAVYMTFGEKHSMRHLKMAYENVTSSARFSEPLAKPSDTKEEACKKGGQQQGLRMFTGCLTEFPKGKP